MQKRKGAFPNKQNRNCPFVLLFFPVHKEKGMIQGLKPRVFVSFQYFFYREPMPIVGVFTNKKKQNQ
jgi:hypothetical protein